MKKKLDGGLKKKFIFFLFFIFSSESCLSSQILDYESELFINQILVLFLIIFPPILAFDGFITIGFKL